MKTINKEELIGKLQMVYVGDKNALNELIGYYDGLKQGIEELQQENQELKKQLEEYENEPLTSRISRIDCVVSNIYSRNKTQQKEFISYLENMLDNENDIFSVVRVKDVLSKYKSIIGGKK